MLLKYCRYKIEYSFCDLFCCTAAHWVMKSDIILTGSWSEGSVRVSDVGNGKLNDG